MTEISEEYQADYFGWQSKVGQFGGRANLFKFEKHIKNSDRVLDYGCGGGYLLEQLNCALRIGIDINPVIQAPDGVSIFRNYQEVVDQFGVDSFDVIISNHAMEHIDNPVNALKECYQLLKPGGRIIIVVPSGTHRVKYRPNDINKHIITFAPMNLGNLLTLSGFQVKSIKRLFHKWPRGYVKIARLSPKLFHYASYVNGLVKPNSIQLIAVAEKPK